MRSQATQGLVEQGFDGEKITAHNFLNLRFAGTDTSLMLEIDQRESFKLAALHVSVRAIAQTSMDISRYST